MSRQKENKGFTCENCGREVLSVNNGSYRNHCPFCLYSKHVDVKTGDRKNRCDGLMKPTGIIYKSGKGFQIVYRCLKCGERRVNKIAEGTIQSDDIERLAELFQGQDEAESGLRKGRKG